MQKLLFIINPVSGGKEKTDWEEEIRSYFKEVVHTMEFYLLTGTNDTTSVQYHIESTKPDKVVAVGGDGTIKLVAEILKGSTIPLGIIPAGSANGMAKELNIPADVQKALEIAVNGRVAAIDMVRINNEEDCIHLSDMGLNAMLVKDFEHSKSRGMWGYSRALMNVLLKKRKLQLICKLDKETIRKDAYMAVLANARTYGTGALINPDGDVSDGFFEVVIVRKVNVFELLRMLLTQKSFASENIEIYKTRTAEISAHKKSFFQVDGEYRGKFSKIRAEIAPGVLKVVLPPLEQPEQKP
jgi:diacylglycerol kinase (ATP)